MKNLLIHCVAASCLLVSVNSVSAQVLDLGTISNFVVFAGNGAITNTGISTLTGDVGADLGAVSLTGATVNGTVFNTDAVTAQAASDLQDAYIQLMTVPVTNMNHPAAFGNSETLTTGVYFISGAGSLAGDLILDGQNDPDAVFIFRFGGAFNSGAVSSVILTNGTLPCNVFWISEGAIALATFTSMKGSLLSHNGAVSMAENCELEGRLLSTAGTISFSSSVASMPSCTTTVPLTPPGGCVTIDLGSLISFALFTSNGAVGNTGPSDFIGDIGSDIGAISGFGTATVAGSFYNADVVTAQAAADLSTLYTQLISIPITNTAHAPAYGGGETLTAGVYLIAGAGSLAGNLILDAAGDPDALFIFRFNGAFTTGAASSVTLLNGAMACNIFWVAEGAISLAASTVMKGILLANNAANSMAAGCSLEGRMFSTTGAIAIDNVTAHESGMCSCTPNPLPIELLYFTAECNNNSYIEFTWKTESELNNHHFTIQHSTNGSNWEITHITAGGGNSSTSQKYAFTDLTHYRAPAYFRLSQTNTDGNELHHSITYVKDCVQEQEVVTLSPNPSTGTFEIAYSGNAKKIISMTVYDVMGKKIYSCKGFQPVISLSVDGGIFLLHIDLGNATLTERLIILN